MSRHRISWRALITVLALSAAGACGSPARQALVEGAADPRPIEGSVAVLTTLTGERCRDQSFCAQQQAIRAVLFAGVPDSPNNRPLVGDETAARKQHKAFFDALLDQRGFVKYIIRVSEGGSAMSTPSSSQSFVVTVNVATLRTALEKEGITRRFGY